MTQIKATPKNKKRRLLLHIVDESFSMKWLAQWMQKWAQKKRNEFLAKRKSEAKELNEIETNASEKKTQNRKLYFFSTFIAETLRIEELLLRSLRWIIFFVLAFFHIFIFLLF